MQEANKTFCDIVSGNFADVLDDYHRCEFCKAMSTLSGDGGLEVRDSESIDVTRLENLWAVIGALDAEQQQNALHVAECLGLSPTATPHASVSPLGVICMAMEREEIAMSLVWYRTFYKMGLIPRDGMAIITYHEPSPFSNFGMADDVFTDEDTRCDDDDNDDEDTQWGDDDTQCDDDGTRCSDDDGDDDDGDEDMDEDVYEGDIVEITSIDRILEIRDFMDIYAIHDELHDNAPKF